MVLGIFLPLFVPAEYALFEGAEVLAVLGLLLIQVSALLLAPRLIWKNAAVIEERWKASRLAEWQVKIGQSAREAVGVFARITLSLSAASPPLVGLSLWLNPPLALAYLVAFIAVYSVFFAVPAFVLSGILSGYLIPARWRDPPEEAVTLSGFTDKLFSSRLEARTHAAALVLFLLGTAFSVVALAPGNAPF